MVRGSSAEHLKAGEVRGLEESSGQRAKNEPTKSTTSSGGGVRGLRQILAVFGMDGRATLYWFAGKYFFRPPTNS